MSSVPKAVAASVAAVVVLTMAIALAVSRGTTRAPAAGGTTPATSTVPATSSPPVDLAVLTRDVPCPGPKSTLVSTDALTDFDAVAVFDCGSDERTYSDGQWTVETRRASTQDVAGLIQALQAPAPPEPSDYGCDLVAYAGVGPAFVNRDGDYVVPRLQRDSCGTPIGLAAIDNVRWEELSTRKVQLDQSAPEIAAGCTHQYKNMNYEYVQAQNSEVRPRSGGPVFPADGATLHACVYRTPGGDPEVGTFVENLTFTADQSDRLRTALSQPGTSAGCEPQHEFALVFDGKHQVDVELGGCYRVLPGYGPDVGTADGSVLRELFGQP